MARPLSSPPFADSPGSWLAQFRLRGNSRLAGGLSPEQVGAKLGVSGATVRRWEGGSLNPRDEDIIRFGELCELSHHQIDFLRTAFSAFNPPLPPDPEEFRINATRQLTARKVPMVMFDELMYACAWNTYVSVLGKQAVPMLHSGLHPIESFFDWAAANSDCLHTDIEKQARIAVRAFWRFTAYYCREPQYKDLVQRLGERSGFREAWSELVSTRDSSELDVYGVGGLLQPVSGGFSMLISFVVYPPVYHVVEYEPIDGEGHSTLEMLSRANPEVEFSDKIHWGQY